jgi:hypothetical protein
LDTVGARLALIAVTTGVEMGAIIDAYAVLALVGVAIVDVLTNWISALEPVRQEW